MAAEDDEISWMDVAYVVITHWRLLTLGPLLVGLTVLGLSFLVPPTFTASTSFLPSRQHGTAAAMLQSFGALSGLAGVAAGLQSPADQHIAFLKSRAVQDALINRFKLQERYDVDTRDDARKALTSRTDIRSGKDGLILIEVDDHDPVVAARLANAHVEELGKLLDRIAITEAQQRRQFFERQLLQTKENMTEAEQALKATGIDASAVKNNPVAAVAEVARLQAEITAQEVKLASMRGYLTESAPEFKQAQNELAALREQGAKIARSTRVEEGNPDYIARYRDVKYHETLFELFARQFELAKVDESREGAVIQVLDVAQPPERKSKPRKAVLAVVATVVAALVLALFVLARQALRQLAMDPRTAEKVAGLRKAWR